MTEARPLNRQKPEYTEDGLYVIPKRVSGRDELTDGKEKDVRDWQKRAVGQ